MCTSSSITHPIFRFINVIYALIVKTTDTLKVILETINPVFNVIS